MDNLFISVFCGLIILVDITSAYFGWLFFQKRGTDKGCLLDRLILAISAAGLYLLAVNMTTELMFTFDVVNNILAYTSLFVPVGISSCVSIIIKLFKRHKGENYHETILGK